MYDYVIHSKLDNCDITTESKAQLTHAWRDLTTKQVSPVFADTQSHMFPAGTTRELILLLPSVVEDK